jgi:4-hydroxy-2-oxoheptanedioate aldolase
VSAARKAGLHAGIHCISTDYAKKMIALGFDFVTIGGSDMRIYAAAVAERVAQMRA